MIHFHFFHPEGAELSGFIPSFLNDNDPRPAREQLDANYQHGGGWQPMTGWRMEHGYSIHYSDDPPYFPVACIYMRDERIFIYRDAWVAIVQPDRSYEIARMD